VVRPVAATGATNCANTDPVANGSKGAAGAPSELRLDAKKADGSPDYP
jgi:hypothetical protein